MSYGVYTGQEVEETEHIWYSQSEETFMKNISKPFIFVIITAVSLEHTHGSAMQNRQTSETLSRWQSLTNLFFSSTARADQIPNESSEDLDKMYGAQSISDHDFRDRLKAPLFFNGQPLRSDKSSTRQTIDSSRDSAIDQNIVDTLHNYNTVRGK